MGISWNISGLKRDGRAWPSRSRSLHADFCAGERVMVSVNRAALKPECKRPQA
ncbi:hypothetical protein HMPREF0539_0725 [Lacticaseibacillus rhamnosus LMS2-1]|uniref:Uncharacterized protein n=1 Tax=Lacticaseibacillus rhamnosus (strain LMS2-1) TaxID=525361 RepID=C2JUZ1_LACRM|nr:hypothetical protein HMPREF0539_0725 [Lacticaseibacillus rhamnosus LMS2-1]